LELGILRDFFQLLDFNKAYISQTGIYRWRSNTKFK
jgi:hypothetical protein